MTIQIVFLLFTIQLFEAKIEIYDNLNYTIIRTEKLPYFSPQKFTTTPIIDTRVTARNYSIFSQFVIQLRSTPSTLELRKLNEAKTSIVQESTSDYKRVCVFLNWAATRDSPISRIAPEDIDPFLCTHIHYAYANVDVQNHRIVPSIRQDTSTSEVGEALYVRIMRLKLKNPKLKILLSIGGDNARSTRINRILSNELSRQLFIENVMNFMRYWKFDGLDVHLSDFESGTSSRDVRESFVMFFKHLNKAYLDEHQKNKRKFYLSAFLAPHEDKFKDSHDLKSICKYLDYASIETYDYTTTSHAKTGYNAPLYSRSNDKSNVNSSINLFLNGGCPPRKLLLGIPTYARAFRVAKSTQSSSAIIHLGVQSELTGVQSKYTAEEEGVLSYYEVCELMSQNNTKMYWDDISMVPFAIFGQQSLNQSSIWISYEDGKSARKKAEYVKKNNLGGVSVWSLDMDDFKSKFCHLGPFPIIDALRNEFDKFISLNPDESLDSFGTTRLKKRKNSSTLMTPLLNATISIVTIHEAQNRTTLVKNEQEIFEILKKFKGVRQFSIITKLSKEKYHSSCTNAELNKTVLRLIFSLFLLNHVIQT